MAHLPTELTVKFKPFMYPRHPVIPPEVNGVLGRAWGSKHLLSRSLDA